MVLTEGKAEKRLRKGSLLFMELLNLGSPKPCHLKPHTIEGDVKRGIVAHLRTMSLQYLVDL